MTISEQLNEFVFTIKMMPRDELAAYVSILFGLVLVIAAVILWLP